MVWTLCELKRVFFSLWFLPLVPPTIPSVATLQLRLKEPVEAQNKRAGRAGKVPRAPAQTGTG